jgi:hypothetical protein
MGRKIIKLQVQVVYRQKDFSCVGNEFKNKMKETVTKCERERKGHQDGWKGLSVHCVGRERKYIAQIVWL